ncbi:PREDICTED: protein C19orf12 homolog [Elephantulus edwardii]|uniref:protein C19orf12 homolog n=1 Tax=Elephantulus edwardii TaxID=28737 RepID=UPI0003F0A03D|nr:PREDICTED: protein C19orf12 homolog [Elephantulus edwardii]
MHFFLKANEKDSKFEDSSVKYPKEVNSMLKYPQVEDIIQLLCFLSKQKMMKAAFKCSMVESVIGEACTRLIAWMTNGEFKPVYEIIEDLPLEEKKLFNDCKPITGKLKVESTEHLTVVVKGDESLTQKLLTVLEKYLTDKEATIEYGD